MQELGAQPIICHQVAIQLIAKRPTLCFWLGRSQSGVCELSHTKGSPVAKPTRLALGNGRLNRLGSGRLNRLGSGRLNRQAQQTFKCMIIN
jgi:hypothetical protein